MSRETLNVCEVLMFSACMNSAHDIMGAEESAGPQPTPHAYDSKKYPITYIGLILAAK